MEAVKLRQALSTVLHLSSIGNRLLQSHKLDNALAKEQPERCAAVAGLALNHVHLLASVIAPYMPATTQSILQQLSAELLIIPDEWHGDSIKPGHKIGKAAYLFSQIKPEKEKEWREMFGGEEARKAKMEKEAKAAARKADKDKKKAKKAEGKNEGAKDLKADAGKGVEAVEKDGVQSDPKAGTAVEEVTQGTKQVTLQTS